MEQSNIAYNGNSFLIWGYSTVFFSLLVFMCLKLTADELYYCLYAGVPISANVIIRLIQKSNSKSRTENLINKVWALFGGFTLFLCIGRYYYTFPLFAFISSLMGVETIVTGIIIKYRRVVVLGLVGIVGMMSLLLISGYEQNLIITVVFFFISVIPGHIINCRNIRI